MESWVQWAVGVGLPLITFFMAWMVRELNNRVRPEALKEVKDDLETQIEAAEQRQMRAMDSLERNLKEMYRENKQSLAGILSAIYDLIGRLPPKSGKRGES